MFYEKRDRVHISVYPVPANPAWFEIKVEHYDWVDCYRIPAKDELDAYRMACRRAMELGCVVT